MNIALVGNPNTGKTLLFNLLTGARQKVANLPGVTVEKKEGTFTIDETVINAVDLPGIYSLDPDTEEQRVTKEYLIKHRPDLILNIIDSTNIERNLYLTLQLRALGMPIIAVLNIIDQTEKNEIEIDIEQLSRMLRMPVVAVSAYKKSGIEDMFRLIGEVNNKKVEIAPACLACNGCDSCSSSFKLYKEIEFIIAVCVKHPDRTDKKDATYYIDTVVLNKYLGIPIFFLIMFSIFSLTFSGPSIYLSDLLGTFLEETVSGWVTLLLGLIHMPDNIISIVGDGVIPGVGGVLTFLPQIALLFILLSLLEDSGYMTRAAFVADRMLSFTGLSGSSFIPLVMGFGCAVPAIMSCRTLPSKKDSTITIMMLPFIICSARFPVIALFAGLFFKSHQGLFVSLIYFIGIAVSVIVAMVLNRTMFNKEPSTFVMEMPPYRLPAIINLLLHTWEKVKGFLIKAGTTLLAASIVIWFLSAYSFTFAKAADMKDSMIAVLSGFIAPLFAPLGFGTWQASASVITGIGAKEIIVSTLSVLYPQGVENSFSNASALSFVVFSMLYTPCLSSIVTMKQELKSYKLTALTLAISFLTAYVVSFITYIICTNVWR